MPSLKNKDLGAVSAAYCESWASLSISEGDDGRVLLKCFAGCDNSDICRKLGIGMRDLFPDAGRRRRVEVAVYQYRDAAGKLVYEKVRYEPKDFRLRRPDGKGGYIYHLEGVQPLLYNLPALMKRKSALFVEGEKDCETARRLSLVATTSGGTGSWRQEFAERFQNKRLCIIADADPAGRKLARQVLSDTSPLAEMVKLIEMPRVKDLTEWVEKGGTREKLLELIQAVPVVTAADLEAQHEPEPRSAEGFKLTLLGDLLAEPEEETTWLLDGILPAAGVALLAGKPKAGKSTLARCLALAVARGESFLNRITVRGAVLYLALEEKRSEVKKHFEALGATGEEEILIHAEHAPAGALAAAREAIRQHKPVLVIVDPLLKFARVKDANDYAQVTAALEPLLVMARGSGAHLLLVYHAGKGEKADSVDAALGSTAFAGAVDTLLVLKRSERYRTLQTVQRYGQDLPETLLEFDAERRAVGIGAEKSEAEVIRIGEAILEYLAGCASEPTEPEICEGVEGKAAVKRAALRELVSGGRVTRTGGGKRGDPFRYRPTEGFSFACSPHMSGTREQETKKWDNLVETEEHILVPAISQGNGERAGSRERETGALLTGEMEV